MDGHHLPLWEPQVLITNNHWQAMGSRFKELCEEQGILHHLTSVAYPQANRVVEVMNQTLLHEIKRRLGKAKGSWVDELHNVLWAYRTMPKVPTGETPFSLAFRIKALIPIELEVPSVQVQTSMSRPTQKDDS